MSAEQAVMEPRAGLFVDDKELHRRTAPHVGWDSFRAAIRAYEQRGFPKANALFRGRYWPAVQAWLDAENGLIKDAPATAIDGEESF